MKIEVGKFYKTRAGQKVRICTVDGKGRWSCHGAILFSDGWDNNVWDSNGMYSNDDDHEGDIIAEWKDEPVLPDGFWEALPAWHNQAVYNPFAKFWVSGNRFRILHDTGTWASDEGTLHLPDEYAPTFSGDWRDSLIERPAWGDES